MTTWTERQRAEILALAGNTNEDGTRDMMTDSPMRQLQRALRRMLEQAPAGVRGAWYVGEQGVTSVALCHPTRPMGHVADLDEAHAHMRRHA